MPYVKDYLNNEHPMPGNPSANFISGTGKSIGRFLVFLLHSILYPIYLLEKYYTSQIAKLIGQEETKAGRGVLYVLLWKFILS